ncbi:hypothetical protein INT47_010860 [Mucor saturninus]|uniref:Uncharacterized protein n=1 Tax=Mucor saturninus TaxID=64648 RepID=A0A8H7V2M0_9FUNG|nr:hypothetical protein INT47_010860 [Mucor saturninus]
MVYIISEAAAVAIFTVTRLFYNSVLGSIALILFSKLPGGSSARFWYEQPDMVSKVTSMFHPFGPTGKRGVKSTNVIALLCTIAAVALNILPTVLSKMSPITVNRIEYDTNSTLAPISNIFIPTLTDINLPGLSNLSTSRIATNKFLCTYLRDGCVDAKNVTIAQINWDPIEDTPVEFYHADSSNPNDLTIGIDDVFGTTQQYMFLARAVFNSTSPFMGASSIGRWSNNSLSGFYTIDAYNSNLTAPFDFLHSDQIFPMVTPDLVDLLIQGKGSNKELPVNGSIDRAERWVSVHRNSTLSSLLWQTVNSHQGTVGSDWRASCFFCSLLDINEESSQAMDIQNSLIASTSDDKQTFAIHSYIDNKLRLSTTLCLIKLDQETNGLSYYCLHTYSQLWTISHVGNPYTILGNYNEVHDVRDLGNHGTPFPVFPPPELSIERSYFPIVPVYQIRSSGKCDTPWNYQTQTVQSWMNTCARDKLGQVDTNELGVIATNIWQLSSTITVGGFLVNATYFHNEVGILIDIPVIVIVLGSVILCLLGNLVVQLATSPIHRQSLYEAVRVMVPNSKDPYNVQKMILNLSPTNTLRLVDSIYDNRVSYLKLNDRLIVALAEDNEIKDDDTSTLDNVNMSPKEIQTWSRRQLLNF